MSRLPLATAVTGLALLLPAAAAGGATVHSVPPGVSRSDPDFDRFRLNEDRDPLRSFEDDSEGWLVETWKKEPGLGEPAGEPAELSSEAASHGRRSVALPFRFPRSTAIFKRASIGGFRYIAYDVLVPRGAGGRVRSLFFLKDKDGLWFQSISGRPLLRGPDGEYEAGRSASRLVPGRWNTVAIDLRPGRSDLLPEGHLARWQERFAQDAEVVGFAVFGEEPQEGIAYVDNLRGWTLTREAPPALAVRNLTLPREGVTFEKWEATFELTREFENPFDPDVVSVDAVIRRPVEGGSGEEVCVPGFWYQKFERRLTAAGEELVPVGPGLWKIRYGPREAGRHVLRIEVGAGSDSITMRERAFTVREGSHPGFVRVSERDPRTFEFTSGRPFYPIGHNVRSPTDSRCSQALGWELGPDEGTFTYDLYLERMAAAGENLVEIWMASWWVGLEWTLRWKFYRGLGRYNLASAWRLDYLLERSRELGLWVNLVIDNHGKYSSWCDKEWAHSPYNALTNRSSGGFLARPDEFFTDEDAKRCYRNKARYVFARWGWDPTIMGFELVSELNLTGQRHGFAGRRPGQDGPDAPLRVEHRWHKEVIEYFRSVDSGRHLYTTHYSGDYNAIDPVMARLPEIDYIVGDGYRGGGRPFVDLARATGSLSQYRKPFMITEYGGNWNGTSEAALEADLHSGLWGGYMTPAGGTALLWWFDFVDRKDLYWHFTALRNFDEGEDRRDPELKSRPGEIESKPSGLELRAIAYMSRTRGYAWVYAEEPMIRYPAEPVLIEGARVRFDKLENGPWAVELWDTVKGKPVRSEILRAKRGSLEVDLPRFGNDTAVKLCRADKLADGRPSRPTTAAALEVLAPLEAGSPPGFISNWALLGPFKFPHEQLEDSLDRSFVDKEPRLTPRRGDGKWRFVEVDDRGHVDLDRLVGPADLAAAYAVCELWCEREMRDVELLVGSDDYVRVWLGGKQVIWSRVPRAASPDQDRARVRLRKGSNLLVLKVIDRGGGWGFYCRLATGDGRPLPVRVWRE